MNQAPKNIFLLAGQSNMVGHRTAGEEIPRKLRKPASQAQIWVPKSGWRSLHENAGYQKAGFGPEFGLAATLVLQGIENVAFIKVASSGSDLENDWSSEKSGGLFDALVDQTKAALEFGEGVIRGVFWLQGESDAMNEDTATSYKKNFEKFANQLRACLGNGTMPIVTALPPENKKTMPHFEKVRRAIETQKLNNVSYINADRLDKQSDDLHYTVGSLHRMGRLLALRFLETEETISSSKSVQHWLWRGKNLEAWMDVPIGCTNLDNIVVSFPYAVIGDGTRDVAFGRELFARKGIPAIYVRSKISTWFQSAETFEMCKAIRSAIGDDVKLIAYGASMGAYGALLTSKALNTSEVIAVAPQYSINRKEVPWETRWSKAIPKIGKFVHSMNDHLSDDAKVTVIYDSKSMDQKQVELFRVNKNWNLLKLPYATHQILRFISETGKIGLITKNLPIHGPDPKMLRREIRSSKKNSYLYMENLARSVLSRRPELAIKILQDSRDSNGARPRRIREQIQNWQEKYNIKPN